MKKPHEETWSADDGIVMRADGVRIARIRTTSADPQARTIDHVMYDDACTLLTAQAPAMARALIEMGKRWNSEWSTFECQCCSSSELDGRARIIHPSTCELAATLRAAGVLS
jgi:hypothetical protein